MKVVAWKDINILDKTTYTKRLDPRNDWVVPTKEESIRIVSCLQTNNWDGTVVHYYQDEDTERDILKDYYLDSTNGAVHYQHHIYFSTATLHYPRVNYKWYAAATRDERRKKAEIEFATTDTPWELLWDSDTDASDTYTDKHGDAPVDRVRVRNLKYPDVRALVQVPPTEDSLVVEGWVDCTRSNQNLYKRTKYKLCKKTQKYYRKILKKSKNTEESKASTAEILPDQRMTKTNTGLNTTNPYPVLDRIFGIERPQPGFAVNENEEILTRELIPPENKLKRKLRTSTENQRKKKFETTKETK
jgi:hypothetical protein